MFCELHSVWLYFGRLTDILYSKTNFYTPTKVALSFRFNPEFLPELEYPQPLFGMFLVIGSEFRGFHLVIPATYADPRHS